VLALFGAEWRGLKSYISGKRAVSLQREIPRKGTMSENLTIFLLQPALRPVLLAHANSKGYFRPPEINPAARKGRAETLHGERFFQVEP
jgi:hypothetical protein